MARGRIEEARTVLTRLFGSASAEAKVGEIRGSLAADHTPRLSDLIDRKSGRLRGIVWVGVGLATFQQLVGINVVFYYGAVLWQAVGFSEADSLKINILSGTLSIAACLLAIFLIDRIGRKPLLLIGSIGMAITLSVLTVAFATGELTNDTLTWHPMGQIGADQRQSICHILQPELGAGHVGDVGRDVPQPDPRLGARGQRRRPVDVQFSHQRELSGAG